MEKILLLAHTDDAGALAPPALEALSAARILSDGLPGSSLTVGLVGGDVMAGADQIASCGAAKMLGVAGPDFLAL